MITTTAKNPIEPWAATNQFFSTVNKDKSKTFDSKSTWSRIWPILWYIRNPPKLIFFFQGLANQQFFRNRTIWKTSQGDVKLNSFELKGWKMVKFPKSTRIYRSPLGKQLKTAIRHRWNESIKTLNQPQLNTKKASYRIRAKKANEKNWWLANAINLSNAFNRLQGLQQESNWPRMHVLFTKTPDRFHYTQKPRKLVKSKHLTEQKRNRA